MRQVLIDRARRRQAVKRGGGQGAVDLDEGTIAVDAFADGLVDLDAALKQLARLSSRQVRVVECRYFGGMSVEETAEALGVSPRTVRGDWALARARRQVKGFHSGRSGSPVRLLKRTVTA